MEYERKQFFREKDHDDVKGFTVLETEGGKYHIAEKWIKSGEGEDIWMDYWISESDLLDRIDRGDAEPAATLTDEQYKQVCINTGWRYDERQEVTA